MRKAMLLLAVFGLVGSLWAGYIEVGTWKVNVAKSKFPPTEATPKEETLIIRVVDDQFETVITGTRIDGTKISEKFTNPLQGGEGKYQEPTLPKGESVVQTRVDAYSVYFTTLQNGRQIEVNQCVVSKDGKTITCKAKGMDAKGKPYESLYLFEKQ
jgi:hypothetical protein